VFPVDPIAIPAPGGERRLGSIISCSSVSFAVEPLSSGISPFTTGAPTEPLSTHSVETLKLFSRLSCNGRFQDPAVYLKPRKERMRFGNKHLFVFLAGALAIAPAQAALAAQNTASAPSPARVVGSVTAINGNTLTVKPDTGAPVTFTVSDKAKILETQPGAKTLAGATPVELSGIAVGDRVLAALHSENGAVIATTVIAMKKTAVTQHQAAEAADWQRRGVGGLVKSVDTTAGIVTIASGAHTITVRTTLNTVVRRYSPDSIEFADAQPSTLAQIQPGDQLRARGEHSADGAEVTAVEIVAGSFRNIAGTVESTDSAANTVTVKDLETKRPVVIHITADSRMHKLPEEMAAALARGLKRGGKGAPEEGTVSADHERAGEHARAPRRGGDLSQMLQHTPQVQLADLHKGDAVMIVATQGTPESATAVTLLAGVEPLLTASPSASRSMFSASWDLGGGGGGGGDDSGGGGEGSQQ
jgi:hypothetical protein